MCTICNKRRNLHTLYAADYTVDYISEYIFGFKPFILLYFGEKIYIAGYQPLIPRKEDSHFPWKVNFTNGNVMESEKFLWKVRIYPDGAQ